MTDFTGFPKDNFRELMIDHWMEEGFKTRGEAYENYGGKDFDALCEKCDGSTLLEFNYDVGSEVECFEVADNNFVIPVSAIDIYKTTALDV